MKTTALALALLLTPALAHAGGVALPSRGVRATSMGGAFVAGADGVNALWANPANLDESVLGLEGGLVLLSASYTASWGDQAGVTVENEGRPIPNPTIGFTYRINDLLSVGVGAFAPYSGFTRFDEAGPQRYALVESDKTTLLYLAGGAALRFGQFRIGGSVQNVLAHVKQRLVLSGYTGLFGWESDPTLDILQELDLEDNANVTGNVGASFDAGPVTIGAAVQLPYTVSGDAKFRIRLPSSVFFDSMRVEGDTVFVEVPFPVMIRGGVLWRVTPALSLEAAVNWENWSIQDALEIDAGGRIKLFDVPGIGDYDLPALVIDRRMKDTLSVHLGADWALSDALHLRGGLFFEPSSFPDETFSVAQLDDDKLGLALGAAFDLGPIRLDVAVSHVIQGTREITTSELRQLNPTNPDQTIVIGNGTYTSSFWVAGLGASWRIGR
ncbi:outer membrane protein transport protein [Myxococcota bacterium]|nr:outer membrane protein transport protein [Myxococcota bacterium]